MFACSFMFVLFARRLRSDCSKFSNSQNFSLQILILLLISNNKSLRLERLDHDNRNYYAAKFQV